MSHISSFVLDCILSILQTSHYRFGPSLVLSTFAAGVISPSGTQSTRDIRGTYDFIVGRWGIREGMLFVSTMRRYNIDNAVRVPRCSWHELSLGVMRCRCLSLTFLSMSCQCLSKRVQDRAMLSKRVRVCQSSTKRREMPQSALTSEVPWNVTRTRWQPPFSRTFVRSQC